MTDKYKIIAKLNDEFRQTLEVQKGKVFISHGISILPQHDQFEIITLVKTFNNFTVDNDPYGEHDFGAFDYNGEKIFWKFSYYDKEMQYGSEDPSNPKQTTRILNIMLANEC